MKSKRYTSAAHWRLGNGKIACGRKCDWWTLTTRMTERVTCIRCRNRITPKHAKPVIRAALQRLTAEIAAGRSRLDIHREITKILRGRY